MKKTLYITLITCLLIVLGGCNQTNQIHASSQKMLNKSIKQLKRRLGPDKGTEFEVAVWSLRDRRTDEATFRALVDGKTPQEIIAMAKENFLVQQREGHPDFTRHQSWDSMIADLRESMKNKQGRKRYQGTENLIQGL